MKQILTIAVIFMLFSFSDKGKHWYNTNTYYCKYKSIEGRFNGKYVSYYRSGKKKSEGYFNNNYRTGNWKVWDKKGNLIIERNYISPFEFTVVEEKGKRPTSTYKLQRDSFGCYKHFVFTADGVLAAARIWRLIEPQFNALLFDNNVLYNTIQNDVIDYKVKAYRDDSCSSLYDFSAIDSSQINIVGFKSMEDWVIDKDRLVLEYYTIALCPIAINKTTKDTFDLYWVLVDDLRKALSKEKVKSNTFPASVSSIDDLFFLHCFQGKIVRQLAFEDNTHPLNKFDPVSDVLRIDLEIVENEHDIWIGYFNK